MRHDAQVAHARVVGEGQRHRRRLAALAAALREDVLDGGRRDGAALERRSDGRVDGAGAVAIDQQQQAMGLRRL